MRKVFMNRKKGSFEVWSVEVKGKLHGVKKVGLFYSTGRGPKGSNAINLTQLVFRV